MHDLGHYPLAHYIEEFTVNLKHHKRTISICKDIYPTIEEGWGLKNKDKEILFDFLNGGSNIKQKLLYSILDGPIDVDKLDYLYRDAMNLDSSSNRFIKINQEEIIKNLTVKVETINNIGEFRIGLYEDGQAGSDLITFSRYSLYNNVYWNSGSRAYDAMLRTVIQIAHDKEDISEFENKIKNAIDNTFTKKPKDFDYENQFIKELTKGLLNGEDYHNLLDLFFKSIIYKRVLTIHYNEPTLSVSDLLTKFREKHKDITFINKLQDKIYISLITELIVQNFSRIRNDQYNNFIIKIFHELNTSITSYDTLKNNLESYLNNSGTFHEFVRHFSDMSFFEGKELINNLYSYTKSVKNTLLKEKNSKGEETFLTTSKTIKEKLESGIQLQDFNDIFIEECMDRNFVQIALKALISLISSGQETIDELEDTADKINTTFQKKLAIIIDTPYSKIGSEDKIFFIPEPNKLKSNYDIRFSILNRTSEIWEEEIHQKLMSIVAKGRIYCHPDIEEYIMRYLGPTKLKEILIELLQ